MKGLYTENYYRVLKEIKNLNKWKEIYCLWFKTQHCYDQFPETNLYIQCNINQNPSKHFLEIKQLILKFIQRCGQPIISKTILEEKKKVKDSTI